MIIYIILFLIPIILYFYYKDNKQASYKPFLFFFISLAVFVGLGDMLGGYDRYIYGEIFDTFVNDLLLGLNSINENGVLSTSGHEKGFVYLNLAIAHLTDNRYIFIFIVTTIIYFLIFKSFKEHITNYPAALVLFLALFFFFTFTYLRQALAVSLAWFAYRYALKKKIIPFLICTFVAYTLHNSAIIFIFFYFIPAKKYSKKIIILILLIAFLIGISGFTTSIYNIFGEISNTAERVKQYEETNNLFRIDYILEVIVFLYFIFKRYKQIPNERTHLVLLNASIIFFIILLLFVTSATAGRLTWYYMFGLIYTLANIMSLPNKKNYKDKILICIICTILYFRIVIEWGGLLSPYKTFLTNGYRLNDNIHTKYEYDSKYDVDKFYKPIIHLK